MNFKLALLLLFGFVALAVAVPLENTEEKAEPAETVAADAEKPEAPLEELDEPEEENDDENEEDEDENNVDDLDDEEDENDLTEFEDPRRKRPSRRGYWRPSRVFKTAYIKSCQKVRRTCRTKRGKKRPCLKRRCCQRVCRVRMFTYFNRRRCPSVRSRWIAHKCSPLKCRSKVLKYLKG